MHHFAKLFMILAIFLPRIAAQRDTNSIDSPFVAWSNSKQKKYSTAQPLCVIGEVRSCCPTTKPRRYDMSDLGYPYLFHGWADVQGQGAANDYCRIVGVGDGVHLACSLAGTHGEGEENYESAWNFDVGHRDTWYMRDEDGDGRDDYCRCLGDDPLTSQVVCTRAGKFGFYGSKKQNGSSHSFTPTGPIDCKSRIVYPEIGRVWGFVI